jgi:hypothetical protein
MAPSMLSHLRGRTAEKLFKTVSRCADRAINKNPLPEKACDVMHDAPDVPLLHDGFSLRPNAQSLASQAQNAAYFLIPFVSLPFWCRIM